ncbi:PBP1A family penicillin-binding protein [Alteromonas sp. W364]|uniref:penicillin-binding protein 1A n=1 Tax=Alteromonas sp. W364 TaxID=3075610 RepID=UPI00288658CE|nr:PBP1A family penicillin-binding protein [Alteromonas sp. W364]MDT0628562.1 PBP1A family penicillin-binding protein [Alteromonas sp. W364]
MKLIKRLILLTIICAFLGVISIIGMYFYLKPELPSVEVLREVKLQTPMRIFTADGKLISQYGVKRRIPVSLDDVPETLVQALIATEDSRFYDHIGVDPIGVVRAFINLVVTGERGQGASTLTMQMARGFFLTREKKFSRKIRELFIALHMEQELSKEQILELYLNKVELGHRAFGFGAAAQVYYGKNLNELNLAQIATLAGLPQAPSTLNPISRPERSKERRRIVLLRMLDEGYITRQQFDEAAQAPVSAKKHGAELALDAPYLADLIYNEMVEIYGKEIAETSGFNVYATAPYAIQKAAQEAVIQNLHDYDERHGYRGPLAQLWPALPPLEVEPVSTETPPLANTESSQDALLEDSPLFNPDAWSEEKITAYLDSVEEIAPLVPAVVLAVQERSASVIIAEGERIELTWDGLDWARPYISDQAQGEDPELASDILQEGMLIYIRKRAQDDVWQLGQFPDASGALVALNPENGAVQAVVGGYSFYHSQFNRATQAKRQVGSNIKPFVYSAAIDNGYNIASIINDAPINQWDASSGVAWRPQNSPAIYDGPIRMRVALGMSKNVVSVRLLRGVGLDQTVDYLTRFGFDKDDIPRDETLSLGSGSHTPLEVVTGIATLANGGFAVRPYFIDRIENDLDEVIWQANPVHACEPCISDESIQENVELSEEDIEAQLAAEFNQFGDTKGDPTQEKRSAERVISAQTAFLVTEMMRSAVRANGNWNNKTYWLGTGWRARNLLQREDIGGKTGTTNDSKDTWFSGFAGNLVATSWVGFDDASRQLGRTSRNQNLINKNPEKFNWIGNAMIGVEDGAKGAQPAWIRFMQAVLEDKDEVIKQIPDGIVRVRIDRKTGKLTRRNDHTSMFEYFRAGTEPTTYVVDDELSLPIDEEKKKQPEIEEIF